MPPHFDLPDRQSEMIVATLRFHPGIKRPSGDCRAREMMLGPCAVRLATAGDLLIVGDGIETCLAAMQSTGHSVWCPRLHWTQAAIGLQRTEETKNGE